MDAFNQSSVHARRHRCWQLELTFSSWKGRLAAQILQHESCSCRLLLLERSQRSLHQIFLTLQVKTRRPKDAHHSSSYSQLVTDLEQGSIS